MRLVSHGEQPGERSGGSVIEYSRICPRDKQLIYPFEILVEVSNTTEASEPYWVYNFQGNKGNKETKLVANTYSFDDFYQVWQIYFNDKNPFPRFFYSAMI